MMASQEVLEVPLIYGQVTHIVDPSDFYLRMGLDADLASFNEFEQTLDPLLRGLPVGRTDQVTEGCTVLVCCVKQDGRTTSHWRRATVMRVDRVKNVFDVFYMDYGNTEIVQATAICQTVPDDIAQRPVICYKCALAGIQPIAKSWTGRGVKTFEKLVSKKTLQVVLVSYNHFNIQVALYNSTGKGRSITSSMLDAETGLPTDEQIVEFSKDVQSVSLEEFFGYGQFEEMSPEDMSVSALTTAISGQAEGSLQQQWTDLSPFSASSVVPENTVSHDPNSLMDQCQHKGTHSEDKTHSIEEARGLKVDTRPAGVENRSSRDEVKFSPDAVVVPGFNLAMLQKRPMLSAEELQKEKELSVRAERKAMLQKDLIACHHDLDEINIMAGDGQKWGQSDLLIGRQISDEPESEIFINATDMFSTHFLNEGKENTEFEAIAVQHDEHIDKSPEAEDDSITPNSGIHGITHSIKTEQETTHTIETAQTEDTNSGMHSLQEKGSVACLGDKPSVCFGISHAIRTAETEGTGVAPKGDQSSSIVKRSGPVLPLPQPKLTAEEEEYEKQKQFKEILLQAVHGEDLEMVCVQFHSLVPPKPFDPCEKEPKLLMEVLFEEAIAHPEVIDLALAVFGTYSDVLKGTELLELLKRNCERFVKMPVAKMPKHHTDFATVIAKLLYMSFDWPPLLQSVVQDFALGCLEKWVIFNKKGTQTGLIQRQVEEMYLECVQVILPYSISVLQEADPERYQFIFDEMRQKVLETKVDYNLRSQLLTLLIQIGEPSSEPMAPISHKVKSSQMESVCVITDSSPSLPPPSSTHPPLSQVASCQASWSAQTVDSGSQTGTLEVKEEGEREAAARTDVAVQTDHTGELLQSSRKTSVSSLDGVEKGNAVVPGRARRRRAVIEHLQQKKEGSCSNTSTTCLLSATAEVLTQQFGQSASSHPSSIERETGLESEDDRRKHATEDAVDKSQYTQDKSKLHNSLKNSQDVLANSQEGSVGPVLLANSKFLAKDSETSGQPDMQSVAIAGSTGDGILQSQVSLSPERSVSAVTSASQAAWQSAYGSEVDVDYSLKVEGQAVESNSDIVSIQGGGSHFAESACMLGEKGDDSDPSSSSNSLKEERDASSFSSNLSCHAINVEESPGQGGGDETVLSLGQNDNALDNVDLLVKTGADAETKILTTIKSNENEVEEFKSQGFDDEDACEEERCAKELDFLPIIHTSVGTVRPATPPPLTQLSLQTIATELLKEPEAIPGIQKGMGKNSGAADNFGWSESRKPPQAAAVSSFVDVDDEYFSDEDDDDDDSIPLDWEEGSRRRITGRATKALPGDGYREKDQDAAAPYGAFQYWLGSGDSSTEKQSSRPPPIMNESGDGVVSEFPPLPQGSIPSRGGHAKGRGNRQKLQAQAEGKSPLTEKRYTPDRSQTHPVIPNPRTDSKPMKEPQLSSSFALSHSEERQPSETSQRSTLSPEKPESYERMDLGCMAVTGKKNKKIKFRPFHPTAPLPSHNPESCAPWLPQRFMCTNCKAEGHTRSECPHPCRDLLD